MDLGIIFWIVGGLVGFLVLLSLFYAGYVIAPPNQAVVITGGGKQRVLLGEAGWMIPFLSTRNYISVEQFKTDVKTSNFVPTKDFINVKADAAVTLKIGTSKEMLAAAAENFLNWNTDDISAQVTDVLEGNLREIIGQMNLREMVNNRQEFAGKVQENVSPDLAKMDQAGIAQMYFEVLPQVVAAATQPLANVDSITMYGEGNNSKMIGDIMTSISTINEGSGMDIRQLLSGLVGANITGNAIGRQIKSATVEEVPATPEVVSE